MKNALTALLLTLCLNHYALAQTKDAPAQPSGKSNKTQSAATTQSPDLIEANRLSAQVAKLYNQGKYDEALPLAKRALELGEKAAEPDQLSIVGHLRNLAEIYIAQKKYEAAMPVYRRALAIYEKKYGKDDLKLSPILERLPLLYFAAGDNLKTESAYQRIVSIKENALGADNPGVALSLGNLAEFYQIRGEYKKAEPLYRRVAAIEEKNAAAMNPQAARALGRYACLLRKLKRPDEADSIQSRAVDGKIIGAKLDDSAFDNSNNDKNAVVGGIINGKAISKPTPAYPAEAKANRVTGIVKVQIVVDEKGRVIDACAIEGPTLLLQNSENAAYRTVFSPTTLSGQPVKVSGTITFNYTLN